jgi:hypothetical protein
MGLESNPPGAFACCPHDEHVRPATAASRMMPGGGGREGPQAARGMRRPPSAPAGGLRTGLGAGRAASTPTLSLLAMADAMDSVPGSPPTRRGFPRARPANTASILALRSRARLLSGAESALRSWIVD